LLTFAVHSNHLGVNKRRPKFVDPKTFLEPEFQNMFNLTYFSGNSILPTGWSIVDDDKTFQSLSSRSPQIPQPADEYDNDHDMMYGRRGSDTSNEGSHVGYQNFPNTRMNDEESEDEISAPIVSRVSPYPYAFFIVSFPPRDRTSVVGCLS